MNAQELDTAYAALANAIQTVGKDHESLFLATLTLNLLSKQADLPIALADIAQARRLALV